jgi:hypothetical protein
MDKQAGELGHPSFSQLMDKQATKGAGICCLVEL